MHLYSHFDKKGYRIEAYIPNNDADIDAFERHRQATPSWRCS